MDAPANRRRARLAGALALAAATVALAPSAVSAKAMTLSCGDTVTQNTTLKNDLIGCPGDGLIIGADGVKLDLGGHLITSSTHTGEGINFNGHNNVVLRGGQIQAFNDDVYINGNRNRVSGTQAGVATYGSATGFYIDGSGGGGNNNTLDRVEASYDSTGLYVSRGHDNAVIRAVADKNSGRNITFAYGGNNTITRSTATNSGDGLDLNNESGDTVTHNTVTGNGGSGMDLRYVTAATVTDNTVSGNGYVGLGLTVAHGSLIARNLGDRNAQNGLSDIAGSGNTVANNTFNDNGFTNCCGYHSPGISVDSLSSGENFVNNITDRNAGDGITDQGSSTLTSNTADFNQGHGIVTSGVDGGGNEAHGNQTPPQCIGVVCR